MNQRIVREESRCPQRILEVLPPMASGAVISKIEGKKKLTLLDECQPMLFALSLEAWTGFEPVNNGFADRSLNHLGTTPQRSLETQGDNAIISQFQGWSNGETAGEFLPG